MLDLNTLSLPKLMEAMIADDSVSRIIGAAIKEDLQRPGDITTRSIIDADVVARATMTSREAGVAAGLELVPRIIGDGSIKFAPNLRDGEACEAGEELGALSGGLRRMLGLERIILNFVGRLSGIASLTRQYVDAVEGTKAAICDTRKTTPGLRALEKYAVRCGGGTLHRFGLYDAALFKDNHLAHIPPDELASRLTDAARKVRGAHYLRFVEAEVDTLKQLKVVLGLDRGLIDIVLLDNMTPKQLRDAVKLRDDTAPKVQLEASGGVSLKSVRAIAETGVDRISVGALTHSAPWLDIGLDISS